MITIVAFLTGVVLGARYKVLCLVPITAAGIPALVVLEQTNEVPLGSTALDALALAVALQIGYLAGASMRSLLLWSRSQTALAKLSACAISRRGPPDFLEHGANRIGSPQESRRAPFVPFARPRQPQVTGNR